MKKICLSGFKIAEQKVKNYFRDRMGDTIDENFFGRVGHES